MAAVEDQSLLYDHDLCQRAASTLTHPRRRLEAEMAWFPGVTPNAATRAAGAVSLQEVDELGLSGLSRANALEAVLAKSVQEDAVKLAALLGEIFLSDDAVNSERLLVEINEDRELAGFPAVPNIVAIDEELQRRRVERRQSVLRAMEGFSTPIMAQAMFILADAKNDQSFPRILHEFIDDYGLRAEPFMSSEVIRAEKLVVKARELAGNRPDALEPLLKAFEELLDTWHEITYPMHRSLSIRGQSYDESERMARLVRDLALYLNNEHNLISQARRLSQSLEQTFSASPTVSSIVAGDLEALESLEAQAKEDEQELAFSARIGMFGGTVLSVSSTGLTWKDEFYPIETVKGARWGAIRKSVNGVPTGTDFLIAWFDENRREVTVNFGKGQIFEEIMPRMMRLLIGPILTEMLADLRNGNAMTFGSAVISDEGVDLPKPRFFGNERVFLTWGEVTISSHNGSLIIASTDHPKTKAEISYREVWNVHFLEIAIRAIFKNGSDRLSGAFG
ncbi:hypothetical protein [Qipengyuania sp. MTN3-11]|uniref:hypothetical protein n=1 Tax=Qipengyuania sp. MTN3-11 TaxID=3056557 RepID=UPI0036F33411